MTEEEFKETFLLMLQTPEGREQLMQIMRDITITREQIQATKDRVADVQMAECMEMVEGASSQNV